MAQIQSIIKQAKHSITPSPKQTAEFNKRINNILKKLKKIKIAKFILGGSAAKQTWLKGEFDIDIFAVFGMKKYGEKSSQLSDILQPYLKRIFPNIKRIHGSRDYFEYKEPNQTYEIIPVLKISKPEQAKNITDISILHVNWVKKHKKFRDEIRLTKSFMKSCRVYGAESYISGFSGYVAEILTIYCKSFKNLIKSFPKLKQGDVIDISKSFKGKASVFKELNQSKLISPIIVIDPLQKQRNAVASLKKDKFLILQKRCKEFIKSPSIDFFVKNKIDTNLIKQASTLEEYKKIFPFSLIESEKTVSKKPIIIILIESKLLEGKFDVVASKLSKAISFLTKSAENEGFIVYDSQSEIIENKAYSWLIFDKTPIPEEKYLIGPPIKLKHHVAKFKKKHPSTFIKKNRIIAKEKRTFTTPQEYIQTILSHQYLKEGLTSIKIIS